MAAVAAAHGRLAAEPDAWIDGHGWDPDRWGRWPTPDDLERAAPGRRAALWAHDHHSLLASRSALATAGVTADTPDPAGGAIRREPDGTPSGVLHETAARLVTVHLPAPDPGGPRGRPRHGRARARPARRRRLPRSRWRGARPRAHPRLPGVCRAGRPRRPAAPGPRERSRRRPRDRHRARAAQRRPARRAIPTAGLASAGVKLFADGSLGSRTAALLEDIEPEPDAATAARATTRDLDDAGRSPGRPGPDGRRGRDRHADPRDRRCRRPGGARCARGGTGPALPLMPRIEHVQLVGPGRSRAIRGGRDRGERPAGPSRLGCHHGPAAVGRPRRGQRLSVGHARARPARSWRSGRMRRSSRSTRGRASRWRSVARIRAGRPARRPSGRPRSSRSTGRCGPSASVPRALGPRSRPRPAHPGPARRRRGHPGAPPSTTPSSRAGPSRPPGP